MASTHATTPVLLALLIAACISLSQGQGLGSCPSVTSSECFFEGAATLAMNEPNPSKRFIVGGFFDVHQRGTDAYSCSTEMNKWGVLNLQAFLWAIRNYGNVRLGTTGITVGAFAFDSCGRTEQNVENMLSYAQCKLYLQGLPQTNLVAYVGPYSNEDVKSLAGLATDLSVPLLAPVANSPDLMYQGNEFVLKLSPSFGFDVHSTFSLIRKLNVEYIILIYDAEDAFWTSAFNMLHRDLEASNTCVTYTRAYSNNDLTSIMDDLKELQIVRYMVPLMSKAKLDELLEAVKVRNNDIAANSFRFILTSDIGQDRDFMASKSAIVNNSLIVERAIINQRTSTDLATFATDLSNSANGQLGSEDVAWITTYYTAYPNDKPAIDDTTPSWVRYSVAKTLEAVDGIMQGMAAAISDCSRQSNQAQICDQYRSQRGKGDALLEKISQAVYGTSSAQGAPPVADMSYTVYHYYVPQSNLMPMFEQIATIRNVAGQMETTFQKDLLNTQFYGTQFTDSGCPSGFECCIPPTTAPPVTQPVDEVTEESATVDPSRSKMVAAYYPRGQEITGAYFDADRGDGEWGTRFDLNHKWIIAIGVLAGLGILSVLVFEIYIVYKLLGTRMGNKWRTMWLGQLLLFGLLLCYLTLFAYIPVPTEATCGITRFGVGVSYSVCFAVLLVKLMVILTSRSSTEVLLPGDVESPNYLKGIYQFLMFIFAVGVQVVINVQWLITVPPEAVPVTSNSGQRVWVCNHYTWEAGRDMDRMDGWVRSNFENHVLSLTYIMVMILITTVLSLNAHGIITNHRESVFIGISAGFSIPIWLAWTLVGGLNDDHDYAHEFGDACIAFGLFLTATLILFAMFLPKVRQLVNMGVEGIYLEDDRDTYYAGSVIMAPPSYKGKGGNSVIYVNPGTGIFTEPVVVGNGDPTATYMRHPGSTYSAPPAFIKHKAESAYGGSRVLRVTDDLKGRHPQKPKTQSEIGVGSNGRPRSARSNLSRARSSSNLGAL